MSCIYFWACNDSHYYFIEKRFIYESLANILQKMTHFFKSDSD